MAYSTTQKMIVLGLSPELAKVIAEAITEASGGGTVAWADVTGTQAGVETAVKTKTQIAALTSGSDAAAIVAALQA